jgi:hypothetical protein
LEPLEAGRTCDVSGALWLGACCGHAITLTMIKMGKKRRLFMLHLARRLLGCWQLG